VYNVFGQAVYHLSRIAKCSDVNVADITVHRHSQIVSGRRCQSTVKQQRDATGWWRHVSRRWIRLIHLSEFLQAAAQHRAD